MHQVMLLTVISFPYICPKLTYYFRTRICTGIISSSTALSWPHGTEFADSCLKLMTFSFLSLICADPRIWNIFENVPFVILQRLADVDYRESLAAMRKMWEIANWPSVFGISATVRTSSHTIFQCIGTELVPAKYVSNMIAYNEFIYARRLFVN